MRLKKCELEVSAVSASVLFDVPPQGKPAIGAANYAAMVRFCSQVDERLQGRGPTDVSCSPHRIGAHNCISLLLQREDRRLNLLISMNGALRWPQPEDERAPRWHISVPDAVDAIYLMAELEKRLGRDLIV